MNNIEKKSLEDFSFLHTKFLNVSSMRVNLLSDLTANRQVWGKHTGYWNVLPRYLAQLTTCRNLYARQNKLTTMLGRIVNRRQRGGKRYIHRRFYEAYFYYITTRRLDSKMVHHILSFEEHFKFISSWTKTPANLVMTVHHPHVETMHPIQLASLQRLRSVITLSNHQTEVIQSYMGEGRVRFIHHGVDTDFFKPKGAASPTRRLVFTGRVHRNIPMLTRVVTALSQLKPSLRFDFVVTPAQRAHPDFAALIDNNAITWHHHIPDAQMLQLFQNSYLLLMPLSGAAANNVIVEALACGLPPITTDVGGVRDYGAGQIYPLVANNDDDAMIALIETYLEDPAYQQKIGQQCRAFAESTLAWPLTAQRHLDAYYEFCEG